MSASKQIAGLLGPTMMVIVVAEFPLVQPHLYDAQIPPVVHLSGVLMFVAGLAFVRAAHYVRRWDWTLLVTLSGWGALLLGMTKMFAAGLYRQSSAGASPGFFMALLEAVLFFVGLAMTANAYSPDRSA
jgi:hypothetical protein